MKIQMVTLKELDVYEVDGNFERRYINAKAYPAFLTHYVMKKGKELGLLDSSLFSDLAKLQELQGLNTDSDFDLSALAGIDETNLQKVIYLAVTGANKDLKLSFDDFLMKYHESLATSIESYVNIVVDFINQNPNQFATSLKKSTNNSNRNKKSTTTTDKD